MIKINLLRTYEAVDTGNDDGSGVSQEEKNQLMIDLSKKLGIILLGPIGLYFYETTKLPELQTQISTLNQSLTDLKQFNDKKKSLAEEIKRYEVDQTRLSDQMTFMRKIEHEKINELKLFKYLQQWTPEAVWITKLELKDEGSLTIVAESEIPQEATNFQQNLSNAPFLVNFSPKQESKFDVYAKGINITVITITAHLASGVSTP